MSLAGDGTWCSTAKPQSGCAPVANICKPMTPAVLSVFQELQRQLNRARTAMQKPTISVDGRLGPGTVGAANETSRAYNELFHDVPEIGAMQVFDTCDDLAATAGGYTAQLKAFADKRGAPAIVNAPTSSPPTTASGGSIIHPPDNQIKATACGSNLGFFDGLMCKFRMMPMWQQVGVGVIGGLGILFVANKVTKKTKTKKAA